MKDLNNMSMHWVDFFKEVSYTFFVRITVTSQAQQATKY